MTVVNKVLAALLVLATFYLGYQVYSFRQDLFQVYDIPLKYSYALSDDADLLVIDFNKYGCGHCRGMHPIIMEAIKQDGRVRYAPRTITFGNSWEKELAVAVYAAGEQGKFYEMHNVIYQSWPISSREALYKKAREIGVDTEQLSRDMSRPEVKAQIEENERFFTLWGLNRTPSLLIGDKGIFAPKDRVPTVEEILEKFRQARS